MDIASRRMGGVLKVSLHPEGGYRLAFTDEFYPQVKDRHPTRDLTVWPKPNISGDMAALAVSICFPTDFLMSGPPPASPSKKCLLLQASEPGRATNVGFFLSYATVEIQKELFRKFGSTPILQWDFADGSSISMVAWDSDFDRAVLPPEGQLTTVMPLTGSEKIEPERLADKRMGMFWNTPGPGVPLQILELGGLSLRRGRGP